MPHENRYPEGDVKVVVSGKGKERGRKSSNAGFDAASSHANCDGRVSDGGGKISTHIFSQKIQSV